VGRLRWPPSSLSSRNRDLNLLVDMGDVLKRFEKKVKRQKTESAAVLTPSATGCRQLRAKLLPSSATARWRLPSSPFIQEKSGWGKKEHWDGSHRDKSSGRLATGEIRGRGDGARGGGKGVKGGRVWARKEGGVVSVNCFARASIFTVALWWDERMAGNPEGTTPVPWGKGVTVG